MNFKKTSKNESSENRKNSSRTNVEIGKKKTLLYVGVSVVVCIDVYKRQPGKCLISAWTKWKTSRFPTLRDCLCRTV